MFTLRNFMATIRLLPSGKWNVQIRKKRKDISKSFIKKSDAEKWARQTEVEIDQNVFQNLNEAETLTLGDVCQRFEDEVIEKFKSWKADRSRLRNIREHKISSLLLINLTTRELNGYIKDRQNDGMSDTSINHEITLISRVLQVCMTTWSIHLPRGIPHSDRPKKEEGRSRRVSDEEIKAIILATQSKSLGPMIILAVETAMRRSELVSIEHKNIKLDKKSLILYNTKNGDTRFVPLSQKAIQVIQSIPRNINGRLFNLSSDSVTQAFERAVDRAKNNYVGNDESFLEDIRFHDLRHEGTTRIAKKVPNIIELASITGHKTVEMLKRYYHPDPTEIAEKLG